MPLGQVTCGQDTNGFYSTLLEDIFLNEKHAIFLKILNFDTQFEIFFNMIVDYSFISQKYLTPAIY